MRKIFSNYDVNPGDVIIIPERPNFWSGHGKYPLELNYPLEIGVDHFDTPSCIRDTLYYGHSISALIDVGSYIKGNATIDLWL